MPADFLLKYLSEVEAEFRKLSSGYIERYEEEWLTPERVNVRIRIRFPKGYMLEWNEAIIAEKRSVEHLGYRYHFQDRDNNLIFRYDNTPHFPDLKTFPNHKHFPDNVIAADRPSVNEVLEEVNETVSIADPTLNF
jgi:hypothetical protein